MKIYQALFWVGNIMLVMGCASDVITLLPSQSSQPSAIDISSPTSTLTLSQPYAVAVVKKKINEERTTLVEVEKNYGAVLRALPQRPRSYFLYFFRRNHELNTRIIG